MKRSRGGAFVLAAIAASVACSTVPETSAPTALTSAVTATAAPRVVLDPVAPIEKCVDVCRVVSHHWGQRRCFPIADTAAAGYCLGTLPAIAADGGTSSVQTYVRFLSRGKRYTQYWYGHAARSSQLELQLGEIKEVPQPSVLFKDGFESGRTSAWSRIVSR